MFGKTKNIHLNKDIILDFAKKYKNLHADLNPMQDFFDFMSIIIAKSKKDTVENLMQEKLQDITFEKEDSRKAFIEVFTEYYNATRKFFDSLHSDDSKKILHHIEQVVEGFIEMFEKNVEELCTHGFNEAIFITEAVTDAYNIKKNKGEKKLINDMNQKLAPQIQTLISVIFQFCKKIEKKEKMTLKNVKAMIQACIVLVHYTYYDQKSAMLHKKTEELAKKIEKVGRNELCPCGSGLKYKKCCLMKDSE